MAVTVYLTPKIGTGSTPADAFRPKFWDSITAAKYCLDIGQEPFCLLAVIDIDPAIDTQIAADATCTKVPPLGNTVGAAQLSTVQAKIESFSLPANWVTAQMTYQTVVVTVVRIILLYQKLSELGAGRLLASGVTLDTTFGALSAGVQSKLLAMAQAYNFDTSGLTANSTIRQILKSLADQWPTPITLAGATF